MTGSLYFPTSSLRCCGGRSVCLRAPEQTLDVLLVAPGDLRATTEATRAARGLLLEEVRPVRLAPTDLAGAGDPVPLRRTSVGLDLGHQTAPESGAAAGAGSATFARSVRAAGADLRLGPVLAAGVCPFLSGWRTIVMFRPSWRGADSTIAISFTSSAMRSRIRKPSSGCAISRPRNMIVNFTLLPSPRNRSTWRILVV